MTTNAATSKVSYINPHLELVDACKNGDQKAQFQIYKLYYKAMYNTSLRIVNDPMEAEDIMQESFLSAFEEISNYSGNVSFGAWLKRIVQNRSLDFLRKNRNMVFEDIESIREIEDNCVDVPCLNDEPDSRMNRVLDIVKLLPKKCRNIFTLYFIEGYDHEEISEILSISESTSRSQLSRARSKFITEYTDCVKKV
jgi:RNA polymerase sigma-70 factor (ECF subfamily)